MRKKKLFKLFTIIMGVIMCFAFYKVQASEITSAFTGEKITRRNIQAVTKSNTISNGISIVPVTLGISESEYKTNNGNVYWTIKNNNNNDQDIYCLNLSRGFGAPNGNITDKNSTKTYTNQYGLTDLSNEQYERLTGLSATTSNKILRILNSATTSDDVITTLLTVASEKVDIDSIGLTNTSIEDFIKEDMKSNTRESTKITFDDIKMVGQIAIWHYTNAGSIFDNTINAICNAAGQQISGLQEENINIDGYGTFIWNGKVKQAKLNALYQYFIDNAEDNRVTVPIPSLQLSKTNAMIEELEEDYIVVGPIEITGENIELIKSIHVTSNKNYTLLDSSKHEVAENNFKQVIGESFYLKIAKSELNNKTDLELQLTYTYDVKKLILLTDEEDPTNTQPVVIIKSEEQEKELEIVIPIELVDIEVNKIWVDQNNKDNIRPDSIQVQLYKTVNGKKTSMGDRYKVTLNAENNWTKTWKNLLAKESGNSITYTVEEVTVPDGYEVSYSDDTFTITNTHIPNEYIVKLFKVGEDGTTPINGAWFKINNGQATLINEAGHEIATGTLSENGELNLTYKLEETVAPDGYIKIDGVKEVKIHAKVELIDGKYEITEVNLLEEIDGVTVTEENNVIVIKVKNEAEITGKYNILLRKVDENGNILPGAKFEINGKEYELTDGEALILENQDLTSNQDIDLTYVLKETKAPDGYEKIEDKVISIKAKVQKEGNNYKLIRAELVDEQGEVITDESITVKLEGDTIVIVVKNTPIQKEFDLALRKFITAVNKDSYSREPIVDTSTIATTGTATYKHIKQPIPVQKGDVVTYTIRVYNEGELDGYVDKITDHLPDNLLPIIEGIEGIDTEKYKEEIEFNSKYSWIYMDKGNTITTMATSKANSDIYGIMTGLEEITDTKLNAYVEGSDKLDYIDVQIKCLVTDKVVSGAYLTNIAEITDAQDINGIQGDGEDSELGNVDYSNLSDYKNEEAINSTENSYIPGQEDDDDFEKLVVKEFDLSLKKFISKVNDTSYSREPEVDTSKLGSVDENGKTITTAIYTHSKEPVIVNTNDIVTFKIRIYNEGTIAGFANEITDNIPEGLEFLPDSSVNVSYRWKMLDSEGNETDDVTKAVMIVTDYLSEADKNNIIEAVTEKDGEKILSYRDVEVQFKVVAKAEKLKENIIKNVAQISEDSNKDIDSIPNRDEEYDYTDGNNEDDIDYEPIKLQYFDLALRKFITKVNTTDYNNRYPEIIYNEDGSITYKHTKDPVLVATNDIVVYTIRVYNEGEKAGYATEITDNLPEGLEFLPENEINQKYGWKLIDSEGNVTEDITKAVKVTTDSLKDELLEPLTVKDEQKVLSYQDVQIAFKVTGSNQEDKIIVNTAEISKDSDDDVDSTPGNNDPSEDDIDKEYVKVQYFDLALKKWVTEVRVTCDGKTTVTKTGFTEDTEDIAKVDLVAKKMNKTTVKFAYKIKVINEGKIPGYAYEVKDYIPKGLKFVAEDNKGWTEIKDGVVVTDQLKDTLLNPGESATVEIVLTWKNSTTNTGLKTNYAEISEDSGDDIDSTPDNFNLKEDDIDDAQVILSIKTAGTPTYIGLIFLSITILAGGSFLIKKYVIK